MPGIIERAFQDSAKPNSSHCGKSGRSNNSTKAGNLWQQFSGYSFSAKKTHKYALQRAQKFPYSVGVNISQAEKAGKTKYLRRSNS
jgi:hypothetical protein